MKKIILSITTMVLAFLAHSQTWNITGNAGTNPSIHFLGTNDYTPLKFRVNNYHAGEISPVSGNVSLGYGAGQFNTSSSSVAIGHLALSSNTSYQNTAVGAYSLLYNSGGYNCAVGYGTLYLNTSGNSNTAMGYSALSNNNTGVDNTAFGRDALRSNSGTNGSRNTAVGSSALFRETNAQYNTAIGFGAGDSYDLGWNNTIIGAYSDGNFHGQYNIVAVGQGVVCPDNSTARIGNSATWSIGGYAGWTNFSDGRFKKDIQENVPGLEFILKLRPVTYHLDISGVSKQSKENAGQEWDPSMKQAIAEKEKMLFTGFVAQEVEQAATAAGYEFSGVDKPRNENSFYGLRYSDFVVPLVKALQEQQQVINDLQKRISELERKSGHPAATDALRVRPNPSSDKITIDLVAENKSRALIRIFDSKGALVKQHPVNIQQGSNTVSIDMNTLASGVYQISAEWNNGEVKKMARIIKQ